MPVTVPPGSERIIVSVNIAHSEYLITLSKDIRFSIRPTSNMGDQNGDYGQGYARGNVAVGPTRRPSISEVVGCTPGRKKCACALSLYGIPWLVAAIILFIFHLAKGNKDSFYLHIATYLFILSVLVLSPPLVMGCLAYRRYRLVKRSRQLADTGTYQENLPSIVHPMTTTTHVPNAPPIVQVPQVVTHPTAPALPMQYHRIALDDPPPSYSEVVSSSPRYLSGMASPYHQKDNIVEYPMASYPQTYDMTGSSSYSSRPFIQTQGRRSPYDSPLLSPATKSGRASPSAYHDGYIPLREALDRTSPHGSMHFVERTSPHRTSSRGTSPGRASPYYPAGGSLNRSSPHGTMHFPRRTSPHRTSPGRTSPGRVSPHYPAGGSLNRSSPHGLMHFPRRTSPHRTSPEERHLEEYLLIIRLEEV